MESGDDSDLNQNDMKLKKLNIVFYIILLYMIPSKF